MYNINSIKTVHLEVTSNCQASCPMCARNFQGGIENPWIKLSEITLEQFKDWFPISFISQLEKLYMCGNTGDPIVAVDTLSIFQYVRSINPNIKLSMNTNGSARTSKWWKDLALADVSVRFGIDGLSDTHSMYRIGTSWDKIIQNASTFINNGGNATWDMLVFKHNEHQVEQCRKLSNELGFTQFVVKHTARFREDNLTVLTKTGNSSHTLYPSEKSKHITKQVNQISKPTTITCKAVEQQSIYVSALGKVIPCCWLDYDAMIPIHKSKIDMLDRQIEFQSLHTTDIRDIFLSSTFNTIKNSWECDPLVECNRQCGKVDKFNEQF